MQTLKSICRIVQGVYSLFRSYICTPHFADVDIPGKLTHTFRTVSIVQVPLRLYTKIAQDKVTDGGWYAWFWTRLALDARQAGSTL